MLDDFTGQFLFSIVHTVERHYILEGAQGAFGYSLSPETYTIN